MIEQADIHITGIVQGVGFRPYIFRVASRHKLPGYVLNLGDAGVQIVIQGERTEIKKFIADVRSGLPSISRIDSMDIQWSNPLEKFNEFTITQSSIKRSQDAVPIFPPDIAICDDCVNDLMNSDSRWYLYPFTSCAACGPRFSTITDLPYDRPFTTMTDFPLCDTCNTGYTNPLDRRYHAQTTACEYCGPKYRLLDSKGKNLQSEHPLVDASKLLKDGKIIAIHGITGTHIATSMSADAIGELRRRKRRSQRPFAIMVRSLDELRDVLTISDFERELLLSWRRPIVLLQRNRILANTTLSDESLDMIAPGLSTVGVFLPYAPVHHLLFKYTQEPALVMTSANPSGIPMFVTQDKITSNLGGIVDYALVHNRRIHQRADDSVIKPLGLQNPVFIRRARGYVPEPLLFEGPWKSKRVLAVGPEEKATGAIHRSNRIYLTQHIGDTNSVESLEFLTEAIDHFFHLLDIKQVHAVAHDLHPEFLSTDLARDIAAEYDASLHPIQHHHAHLAALMVDRNLPFDTDIICITADGYGYGSDAAAWGGEILLGNLVEYSRQGGLSASHLPGGDLSARFAARSVIGLLQNHLPINEFLAIIGDTPLGEDLSTTLDSLPLIVEATKKRIGTIESTSAGRFLDAAALILGICSENSYDGECPMKLEAAAKKSDLRIVPEYTSSNYGRVLDTSSSMLKLIEMKKKGYPRAGLAYAIQYHLGQALAEIAVDVAEENNVKTIGFSGGVALNGIIAKAVVEEVESHKITALTHRLVPPGDGGVSVGQTASAAAELVWKE